MIENEYEKMYRLEDTHWWFRAKRNYVKTVLDLFLKKKHLRILDLGCGTGRMVDLLQEYGAVFGLDFHQGACHFARRRKEFPLVRGDANRLPFKKNSFDLISAFDLLYHQGIGNDQYVLEQAYDLLTQGGTLIITDSAFEFLKSRHDLAVMARHRYTLRELTDKLQGQGFTIIKKTYLYFVLFPLVAVSRLANKIILALSQPEIRSDLKETPNSINGLLVRLLSWEGRLLKYLSFPMGSSLLILAKRN